MGRLPHAFINGTIFIVSTERYYQAEYDRVSNFCQIVFGKVMRLCRDFIVGYKEYLTQPKFQVKSTIIVIIRYDVK